MPQARTPEDLQVLLDSIRDHELAYNDATATGSKDTLDIADALLGRYTDLVSLLQPSAVDAEGGPGMSVTLGGVSLHVYDDGQRVTIVAGAEDVPADRAVFIESWDAMSWEIDITPEGHGVPPKLYKCPGRTCTFNCDEADNDLILDHVHDCDQLDGAGQPI